MRRREPREARGGDAGNARVHQLCGSLDPEAADPDLDHRGLEGPGEPRGFAAAFGGAGGDREGAAAGGVGSGSGERRYRWAVWGWGVVRDEMWVVARGAVTS
jgi:hypothetical protein